MSQRRVGRGHDENTDRQMASGLDTLARIPIFAMAAEILSLLLFRWVNVPELHFSEYRSAGKIWKLQEVAHGLAWKYPIPESVTRAGENLARLLRIGVIAGVLLGAVFILCAMVWRVKAVLLGRIAFGFNAILPVAAFWWVLDTNRMLNLLNGDADTFLNISIYSRVQLTAAAYLQIALALVMIPGLHSLLDTRKEYAAQMYQTRTVAEDHGIGKRTLLSMVLILAAIPLVILFGIFFLNDRSVYFISLSIIVLSMLPFFLIFENRRPQAREVVVIAVMAGMAVAGRVAFIFIPQFKPMAAIVIIAGVGLGAEAGFLTGALAGFVSNFFFGQGPWTPWQMFAFGIIGFLAGLIFHRHLAERKSLRLKLCIFGGLSVFCIYGFLLNTASVFMGIGKITKGSFLAMYASGVPMDMIHATATVIFLWVLAEPMLRKLERVRKKYGILE